MSSALISRNADLKRLRDEGYEVSVRGLHLVVSGVPYVNAQRQVVRGDLISELTLAGDQTRAPSTHVVHFAGSAPCNADGSVISGLQHSEGNQDHGSGLVSNRSFSNKPPAGYPDYYQKMVRYATMVSDPARAIDQSATARTYRPVADSEGQTPFVYLDTNASRAHLGAITAKLEKQRIAIVGVGGTGSYVLDLVAKTPVQEIHLFDGDQFLQHNAFRAPGAASLADLGQAPRKVDYFKSIYERMHRGIVAHTEFLDAHNAASLSGMHYVFLCMDASDDKRRVMEYLETQGIPFIDCGLGIQEVDSRLLGIIRCTTITPSKKDHRSSRISCVDTMDDDYASNIQIAELNALNAVLAVIKWKKLVGFYVDYGLEHHSTFTLNTGMLHHEEIVP